MVSLLQQSMHKAGSPGKGQTSTEMAAVDIETTGLAGSSVELGRDGLSDDPALPSGPWRSVKQQTRGRLASSWWLLGDFPPTFFSEPSTGSDNQLSALLCGEPRS